MTDGTDFPGAAGTKKCDLPGCDVHWPVDGNGRPLGGKGRPKRFCTPEHATAYHNSQRGRPAAPALPTSTTGEQGGNPDDWQVLLSVAQGLLPLARRLQQEHQNLSPNTVQAKLSEAQGAASRALERAERAEKKAADTEAEKERLLEGAEAIADAAMEELAQAREELTRLGEALAAAGEAQATAETALRDAVAEAERTAERHTAELQQKDTTLAEVRNQLATVTKERNDAQPARDAASARAVRAEADRDSANDRAQRAEASADEAVKREREANRERDEATRAVIRANADRDAAANRATTAENAAKALRTQLNEALQRAQRDEARADEAHAEPSTAPQRGARRRGARE